MQPRFHYTIKQKLHILELVRTGQLFTLASNFPKVTQKQISEWGEKEEQMRALLEEEQQTKYTLHAGPQKKYKELFYYLYQVVKTLRSEKLAVSAENLVSFAEVEDPSVRNLTHSSKIGLINRFMEEFNLSIREITVQDRMRIRWERSKRA